MPHPSRQAIGASAAIAAGAAMNGASLRLPLVLLLWLLVWFATSLARYWTDSAMMGTAGYS